MEVQVLVLFICFSLILMSTKAVHVGNETDRLALLSFKKEITGDPHQIFTSWNHSAHFCFWMGITCSRRHGRVTHLELPNLGLQGTVSPQLGNLSFLKSLDIHKNGFHGIIPLELARLRRLEVLMIANNSLQGEIPGNLSNCSRLFYLHLGGNELVGNIPAELGSLSQLDHLELPFNKLTGTIPPSFGNLSALESLSVSFNSFGGRIPSELGRLFRLYTFYCGANKLSGTIPPSLYNLSSMIHLSLAENQFSGRLSSNIGLKMPNLQSLTVGGNEFIGPLPTTLANASHLTQLDFGGNLFTGSVPVDIGSLKNLFFFNIGENRLGGVGKNDLQFIASLTNCTRLVELGASRNSLVGYLPKSTSNLTNLEMLGLGSNQIYGAIPSGIENLVQLQGLTLPNNHLTGEIPATIGKLQRLVVLYLGTNKLSGKIPDNIGNLTQLAKLVISGNQLQGHIPSSLGNCRGIVYLGLSRNLLSGKIPMTLFNLSSLFELRMDNNLLTGPVPSKVGDLIFLVNFYVYNNRLTGKIPINIGGCSMLQQLFMQNNSLSGSISPSLAYVKSIEQLDLSQNNLSGNIPEFLSKLNGTTYLNLSFNNFEGEVPTIGIFSNVSVISLDGNPKLCGGIPQLHLAPCQPKFINHGRKSLSMKVRLSIVASIICTLVITCLLIICIRTQNRPKHLSSSSSSIDLHFKISYIELLKATDGFSSSNLIGMGSFGTVYKGFLQNYQAMVAIKVLNLDQAHAMKTFMDECEALRNIRHRNLVKILTSCSSSDFKGRDFKALVFELMSNGSIEQWLHQQMTGDDSPKYLGFSKRLDVAIDVANALDYLHNQCEPPIVHCDIKPSNILLDNNMVAHLGDFGLAKSLVTSRGHSPSHQMSSLVLKGSIGYIAPEYGVECTVTTHGDVYSYGITLLEMITGKKPTNEMFSENLNLQKYVKMAIPEKMIEIVDPMLLLHKDLREKDRLINCLVCVAKIGVVCSAEYPKARMDIKNTCKELMKVRQVYHETKKSESLITEVKAMEKIIL